MESACAHRDPSFAQRVFQFRDITYAVVEDRRGERCVCLSVSKDINEVLRVTGAP
jgi:hypothetical protein